MIVPELGHFALILALVFAMAHTAWFFIGSKTPSAALTVAQASFIGLAYFCLTYSFATLDFSVAYVAQHAHSQLPLAYRLSAVWGGHEGSMLLWVTLLTGWMLAVLLIGKRKLPEDVLSSVLAILAAVAVGFLLFILATSNPFMRLLPDMPLDGNDLNPLLQDPGFFSHPPMLYMGYVGFSVAFAFAITALIKGKLDRTWVQWVQPWCLAAWSCLTLGITLGSWWAYRELGWGGWWFWDPVENASFMPWLAGTALLHSLIVCKRQGLFKSWTVLMAILAFSLSLLGTFIVRSGVLTSVHAFANDPTRGVFILAFLGVVIGGSLTLYAWRSRTLQQLQLVSGLSKENALLANNVLLVVILATILLGTLYPLIADVLQWGKLSVGRPYFNAVFVPLALPLLALMGVGLHSQWQQPVARSVRYKLMWKAIISFFVVALVLIFWQHKVPLMVLAGIGLSVWILLTTLASVLKRKWRSNWGMVLAHMGVAVVTTGITLNSFYASERQVRMQVGDSATLSGYQFVLKDVHGIRGPNYSGVEATVAVDGRTLHAQKRVYIASQMPMTDAGIVRGVFRDLYVALGQSFEDGSWALRLYVKPFIRWIWYGGLLMVLGGGLALLPRRRSNRA